MANFSFLADKAEFRTFAKDCIDAEETLQNSFDSCVKLVRTAVDAAVKWLYATVKNLLSKLHYCRKAGNDKAIRSYKLGVKSRHNFKLQTVETPRCCRATTKNREVTL